MKFVRKKNVFAFSRIELPEESSKLLHMFNLFWTQEVKAHFHIVRISLTFHSWLSCGVFSKNLRFFPHQQQLRKLCFQNRFCFYSSIDSLLKVRNCAKFLSVDSWSFFLFFAEWAERVTLSSKRRARERRDGASSTRSGSKCQYKEGQHCSTHCCTWWAHPF